MALATRCPQCQSLFRVVADQLKLRGGLVRCGSCRHVFDAIGSLTYVDDTSVLTQPLQPAQPTAPSASASTAGAPAEKAAVSERRIEPAGDTRRRIDLERAGTEAGVPTLILADLPPASEVETQGQAATQDPDVAPAADDAAPTTEARERSARRERRRQRKLAAERAREEEAPAAQDEAEEPAPEFLQGRQDSRGFSIVFGGGSVLLAALMLAQLAVIFRTELSTRFPGSRPTLVQLCKPFGCTVGWPTRAELLAVVGTELQAVPGTDILELSAVIRNRASFGVALPAIEVTLTDTQNRDVARKVFAPVDYLASSGQPSSRIDEGLGAGADYEVRIHFEARGLTAAGYRVYPFYL